MLLVCWKNSHEDWSVHSCVPLSILSIRFLLLMLKISAGNWCSVVIVISPTRITFTRHERKKSEMSWNHAPIFSLILVTSSLRAFSTVNSSVTVNSSQGMVSGALKLWCVVVRKNFFPSLPCRSLDKKMESSRCGHDKVLMLTHEIEFFQNTRRG